MSDRKPQFIAIILIVALWMPIVMLPVNAHAGSPADISGNPSAMASLLGLVWTKMAAITGSPAQDSSQVTPPGMPQLEPVPAQRSEPVSPPSKAARKARVASLKITPSGEVSLQPDEQMTMGAIPLDRDGNAVHGLLAEWESNHPEVVSITADGLATAHQTGKAHLTVRAGNKQDKLDVTVAIPTQARLESNSPGTSVTEKDQSVSNTEVAKSGNQAVEKPRSGINLSHARRRASLVRAAAAPQVIYEDRAYTNEVGSPPGRTEPGASTPPAAISGTEKPGTANFNFNVPILNLPGRGLDASLTLFYNSRLWNKKTSTYPQMYYNADGGSPSPGFQLGYGKLLWRNNSQEMGFTLVDPDGTRHAMVSASGLSTSTEWDTTDGTFIHFSGTNTTGGTVIYPDGTRALYAAGSISSGPSRITDSNGNYIQISYDAGRISTIQDTLGRYVRFYYAGSDLVAITAPGYADTADRQVIRFYYKDIIVDPPGVFSVTSGVAGAPWQSHSATVRVLNYIYFPGTQSGYRYEYSEPYGMIYRTTQLRGMTVSTTELTSTGTVSPNAQTAAWTEYNYPTMASNLAEVPVYTRRTDDWAGRTTGMNGVVAAAPFYEFEVVPGTDVSTSKVTAPDGTVTETQSYGTSSIYNGLIKEITLSQGTAMLARTTMEWEARDYIYNADSTVSTPVDFRIKKIRTTNEVGQTRTTTYAYISNNEVNNYNNVKEIKELDFDVSAGTPGPELRRTETTYEQGTAWTGRRLLHLVTSVKVFEGNSTVPLSWVKYDYDTLAGASLTPRAGIEMHDPAYNPSSTTTYNSATDKRGNLSSVTAYADAATPSNATVNTSSYDIAGNTVSQTVNCCRQKLFTYDSANKYAYPISQTRGDAGQLTTSASYDFNTGLMRSSTDENNQVTTLYYFPDSLRLDYVRRPDQSYTQWHYGGDALVYAPDEAHLNSYVAVATSTGVGKVVWDYTFIDGRGAVARHFKGNPDPAQWESSDVEYDVMGRTKRTSNPYYSTGCNSIINPSGLWTNVEQYDGLGRATQVKLPDNTTVQTAYAGRVITVTDQAGKQRRQVADALGRIIQVHEPDSLGNLGTVTSPAQATTYKYDALNNLVTVTQGTQQRFFKYDSLSHLTFERQIEQAAPHYQPDSLTGNQYWSRRMIYDTHGLLTDSFDARGVQTHIAYDGLNRVHEVTYLGETIIKTPTVTYTYDEAHAGYFNTGRLTKVSTEALAVTATAAAVPQTIQTYDYDLMGRVKAQTQTVGADSYPLLYNYNELGQLSSEQYPSGKVINNEYDDGGRLTRVYNGSGQNMVSAMQYGAHGGVTSETWGNGAVQTVGYNNRLQAEQLKLAVAGVEKQRFDYQYGAVDMTTGTVNSTKNVGQVGRVEGYVDGTKQWQQRIAYDSLGRLDIAAERKGNDLSVVDWQLNYDYDRWGNRMQKVMENQVSAPPYIPVEDNEIDSGMNRLTTSTGVGYDAAGNVTVDGKFHSGQQYGYDGNGRQRWTMQGDGTQLTWAVYDGAGQRVQTMTGSQTVTLIYDIFGQMVAEYGGQASVTGGVKYIMSDVQGSARVMMNGSAGVIARHDYLPFGEEIKIGTISGMRTTGQGYEQADSLRQKYAGMERDESGVDHTLWRKYESRGGRWTTPDPYGGSMSVGDPQSFNRYSYVQNDPVNLVDPSGLDWDTGECRPGAPCQGYSDAAVDFAKRGSRYGLGRFTKQLMPQNTDSHEHSDDCLSMAAIIDTIAQSSVTNDQFLAEVAKTLIAPDANTGGPIYSMHTSRGFRPQFREPPGIENGSPNQVHHYAGTLKGGYGAGSFGNLLGVMTYNQTLKGALAIARKHESPSPTESARPDLALNEFSVAHGVQLAFGLIRRTDLGNLIRRDICGPS